MVNESGGIPEGMKISRKGMERAMKLRGRLNHNETVKIIGFKTAPMLLAKSG
jgi:hypothetical protein